MIWPKPWEVDDDLWALIEPLLPKVERRARYPGRKRHPDRLVFQGILFVLHTGIAWEHLPQELGFASGMTCWRHLAEWTEAEVWRRLHVVAPGQAPQRERPGLLPGGGRRLSYPSVKGGSKAGRSPVDRGRTGSKHHLITDATGIPLAVSLTGGNRNDLTQLIPLLQAVPPVRGTRGRPRRRPDVLLATAATTTTSTAVSSGISA
ncbi:IS5 family transposase [Streptomyces lydicus]|uniref:IS5 family transposase n=1 Tax=Streptomyces lydicus TaxID=47763 RepID=UPI00379A85E1